MVEPSELVTQTHRKTGTFNVHGERLGQFVFKPGLVGLEPPKLGDKAQVVGNGLFKPNEALEGNGVFEAAIAEFKAGFTA